jgi:hypothetical protein
MATKKVIFYSWQSDRPNSTNRGFIQKALEEAVKLLKKDDTLDVEPVIDRDTFGLPGSPDIAQAIFNKIDQAAIYVCDVSIISDPSAKRATPNPNVLIELGYAQKSLGHENVIPIMNIFYGGPETLPFDLKPRLIISYSLEEAEKDKATPRHALANRLARQLRYTLTNQPSVEPEVPEVKESPVNMLKGYFGDDVTPYKVKDFVLNEAQKLCESINAFPGLKENTFMTLDDLIKYLSDCESLGKDFLELFTLGCADGGEKYSTVWPAALSHLAENIAPERTVDNHTLYLSLLSFYAGGLASVASGQYAGLSAMIRQPTFELRSWGSHRCDTLFALAPFRIIKDEMAKKLPDVAGTFTPLNKHLHRALHQLLKKQLFNDRKYEETFIRFEYLLALTAASIVYHDSGQILIPEGSYYWEKYLLSQITNGSLLVHQQTNRELELAGDRWPPFLAGMLPLPFASLLELKKQFDKKMYETAYQRF